jgi:hypothetical protein
LSFDLNKSWLLSALRISFWKFSQVFGRFIRGCRKEEDKRANENDNIFKNGENKKSLESFYLSNDVNKSMSNFRETIPLKGRNKIIPRFCHTYTVCDADTPCPMDLGLVSLHMLYEVCARLMLERPVSELPMLGGLVFYHELPQALHLLRN